MFHPIISLTIRSCFGSPLNMISWHGGGSSIAAWLLSLYRFTDGLKTVKGGITWAGTPTIGADGVVAGVGPTFGTLARGSGKVLAFRIKLTKASTGITGDEQIIGPLYVRNGYLVAKLDGEEVTHAHTWAVNSVIDVKVVATPSGLTVEDF